MSGCMVDRVRNCKPFHGWSRSITLLSRVARKLSRLNGQHINTFRPLFRSDDSPVVSGCIPWGFCFLGWVGPSVLLVFVPPVVSFRLQMRITLIKPWLNPVSYQKSNESFSLAYRNLGHFSDLTSIETASFFDVFCFPWWFSFHSNDTGHESGL
jgi:hypothetical protein